MKGTSDFPLQYILYAYAALFNSGALGKILQYYAPHVAGGQFDLSPRYVDYVPLPNFADLLSDDVVGQKISRLSDLAEKQVKEGALRYGDEINSIVIDLYGPQIFATL